MFIYKLMDNPRIKNVYIILTIVCIYIFYRFSACSVMVQCEHLNRKCDYSEVQLVDLHMIGQHFPIFNYNI